MTITETQFKEQTDLADSAIEEDMFVTKKGKPFVVIMDAKRYEALVKNQKSKELEEPRKGWAEKFRDGE